MPLHVPLRNGPESLWLDKTESNIEDHRVYASFEYAFNPNRSIRLENFTGCKHRLHNIVQFGQDYGYYDPNL